MKKIYQTHVLVLFMLIFMPSWGMLKAISYTWNGSVSNEWSTASNWSPVGVPDISDDVIINGSGTHQPSWEEFPGFRNLTMTGGTFNLSGFNVTVTGNCALSGGVISNGTLLLSGNSVIFSGSQLNCNINYAGPNILFNGSVFNGSVTAIKIGGGNSFSNGGNVFNGPVSITNRDNNQLRLENINADTFNHTVELNSESNGGIYISHLANGTLFNGDITLNSTTGSGIRFGQGGGTCTLASNKTMVIGAAGFNSGDLRFSGFTYLGSTRLQLEGAASSVIYFENSSQFNAPVSASFPSFALNGTLFNDSLIINKTGPSSCNSNGGNTFNGPVTINKNGNGWIRLAFNTGDVFNSNLFVNDNIGNSGIDIAFSSENIFNGNIYLSAENSGAITFGAANGTTALASGKKISIIGSGFDSGTLNLRNFNQLGIGSINLSQPSGTTVLNIEDGCIFNADLTVDFPGFTIRNSVFNGNVELIKNGINDRISNGGNTFNGQLKISNPNSGYILFSYINPDTYQSTVTIDQSGSNFTYLAYAGSGTTFQGNLIINSTASSRGIRIGQNNGTSIFSNTARIIIGNVGYTTGELLLKNVTMNGANPQTIALTSGNVHFQSISSSFDGPINILTPQISISNSTFNSSASFEKVGNGGNTWTGGNIFNGPLSLTVNQSQIICASLNPEIYNSTANFKTSGNALIYLAHSASGNEFNNTISITTESGTSGIYLGQAGGISTLSSGFTIVLNNLNPSLGIIRFRGFKQLGNSPITMTTGSTLSRVYFETNTEFNAPVILTSGAIYLNGSIFNGSVDFTQNGTINSNSIGGNVFNNTSTFTNSGSAVWTFANNIKDIFEENSEFSAINTGARINVANTAIGNEFKRNIIINSSNGAAGIRFCDNNGSMIRSIGSGLNIGAGGFSSGDIYIRNMNQLGNETNDLIVSNSANSVRLLNGNIFRGVVQVSAPQVYLNGSEFYSTANFEQTGSVAITNTGGNIFKAATRLRLSGSGSWTHANNLADKFEATTLLQNTGSGILYMAHNTAGNEFLGGLTLESTGSSQGIRFGQGASGAASFQGSLAIGAAGFTSGNLEFQRLVQVGSSSISILLSGTTTNLYFESGSSFLGNLNASANQVYLNGSEFKSVATFEQYGTTSTTSLGGNIFRAVTTIRLSGTGNWTHANNSADRFESTTVLQNTGSGTLFMANNTAGNVFDSGLTLESTGTSQGIRFGQGTNGSATFQGSISLGAAGFTSGSLEFQRMEQIGTSSLSLMLSGSANLWFETGTIIRGTLNASANQLVLNGATFASSVFTQTGNINTACIGGNTFNEATEFNLTGIGYWLQGNSTADVFNSTLNVRNSGTSIFYLGHNSANNIFNGNVLLSSTGSALGIYICQGSSASATLGNSAAISQGSNGFSSGLLRLKNIRQNATLAHALTLSGNSSLYFETGNVFNGNITAIAPQIFLNGTTFAAATLTQNGTIATTCVGGNAFQGNVVLNLQNSGSWTLSNNNPDVFNGTFTSNNTSSGILYLAHNGSNNQYNGNVTLVSTGSSQGIRFCQGTGSARLASGAQFSIGGAGFTSGSLRIRKLIQTGSTAITINNTNSAVQIYLETGNIFTGNISITSANLFLNGSTYNAAATLTNMGTSQVSSTGGNIFNGSSAINSTGNGEWRLASNNADTYNGDVVFKQTNLNKLYPAYGAPINVTRNISTIGSNQAITFAPNNNNGYLVFGGSAAQQLNADATKPPIIPNLLLNKAAGNLTLNAPITIVRNLNFVSGIIVSNLSNLLILSDNIVVTGASTASHVSGPIRKIGNDAFIFPTGKGGVYRPISISAPLSTLDHFTAELFRGTSNDLYAHASKDASIETISQCEYWILNRTNGTSAVRVNLAWNGIDCSVINTSTLTVARWNGSQWKDHGNGGTTGSASSGSISSSVAITSFSPFSVASTSIENPLPVELVSFSAEIQNEHVLTSWETASETNSHYFEIERSDDLINYNLIGKVSSTGNSTQFNNYNLIDYQPLNGISYYRLIQVDFNGSRTTYDPVVINKNNSNNLELQAWPNPTEGVVQLSLSNNSDVEEGEIQLINSLGKVINSGIFNPLEKHELNLENFPSGVYTVVVSIKGIQLYSKIIKK